MDVEGHELAVFRGATTALAEKRIRHIIFEQHGPVDAPTFQILTGYGYAIFQLGWRFSGLVLADLSAPRICKPYEAPSYLATTAAALVRAAIATPGWHVLKGRMR